MRHITVLGDRVANYPKHEKVGSAFAAIARSICPFTWSWVASDATADFGACDGILIPPQSSDYVRSESSLVDSIRHALGAGKPLLAICGGFDFLLRAVAVESFAPGRGDKSFPGLFAHFAPVPIRRRVVRIRTGTRLAATYGFGVAQELFQRTRYLPERNWSALSMADYIPAATDGNGHIVAVERLGENLAVGVAYLPHMECAQPHPVLRLFLESAGIGTCP